MIQRLKFDITQPYITKPLEVETFKKAYIDSHPSVLNRLYYISNGKKELMPALELVDHPSFIGKVSVSMQCAYAGNAKSQASVSKAMKRYLKLMPRYTIRCRIHTINNAKEIFTFKHVTSSQDRVYDVISQLEAHIIKEYLS
jgi:hypothetical protein